MKPASFLSHFPLAENALSAYQQQEEQGKEALKREYEQLQQELKAKCECWGINLGNEMQPNN